MKTATTEETSWAERAGLVEKPKPKLLDNLVKYVPTWSDIGTGILFIFVGLTAWTGGGIGLKMAPNAEPVWISLGALPSWIGMILILFGVDALIFKGRATPWLVRKYVNPVITAILKATAGEDRVKRWNDRLNQRLDRRKRKRPREQDAE